MIKRSQSHTKMAVIIIILLYMYQASMAQHPEYEHNQPQDLCIMIKEMLKLYNSIHNYHILAQCQNLF